MKRRTRAILILWMVVLSGGCRQDAAHSGAGTRMGSDAVSNAVPSADAELEAACTLLRFAKARIDGVMPPESWPAPQEVRRLSDHAWAVDIDTSRMPSGYPQQLIVEISAAGGHSGKLLR